MSLDKKITTGGLVWTIPADEVKQFIKEILESPLKEVWQIKALIKNRVGKGLI